MFVKIRSQALQLNPVQLVLLTVWALLMVSLPIADWSGGWSAMVAALTLGVFFSAGTVVALLWDAWGAAAALRAAGAVLALSWGAEVIGTRTGIPFGTYRYTDLIGPQIFNVPVQIPLGWLMMLPPAWAAAQIISDRVKPRWKFPLFVGLSALAMTAWDLFLDPLMVNWGIWVWDSPGVYFGIPWINFLGWMLISALITLAVRPGKLPGVPLSIVYTALWLLMTTGLGIFWGIPGAAIAGGVLMGSIAVLAWRNTS